MAYYLQWSASAGSAPSNKELLQISGITGTLSSISYRVKSNAPSYTVPRYIFDIRRSLDSTTSGGGVGYILQFNPTGADSSGTSNHKINGVSATPLDFFNNYLVDDVLSFDVNIAPSGGVIAFGARFNEVEHSYGLAVSEIVVTDAAGVHIINMSSSGGTGTSVTSDTGNLTAKLFNFPTDNSQWVFYSDATGLTVSVTESTSNFDESSSASFVATLSAQVTEVSASFAESSSATITNNIVSVSVTETSQDFSELASASISGSLSAIVTELSQSFTESSTADISANISAAITELAQDFNESAQVNLTSSFTVEVTETTSDFEEACYIQLPVQRLTPRKTISVSNRSGSTIRVRRRSSVIRVK